MVFRVMLWFGSVSKSNARLESDHCHCSKRVVGSSDKWMSLWLSESTH
jgi:hypothetical protein